jgi:hypothetical protein
MTIKYTGIFQSKALQNLPKLETIARIVCMHVKVGPILQNLIYNLADLDSIVRGGPKDCRIKSQLHICTTFEFTTTYNAL